MPSVPKWLANTMEKVAPGSYHTVKVSSVKLLDEKLKWVRFEGDINDASFSASNVIEFRVNDTDYRHYTPSKYDSDGQICEVLFYLHDLGPGSKWATELEVGQELKLIGPGGKMKYAKDLPSHFVFGDETSLGLVDCVAREAEKWGHQFFSLVELEPSHLAWVDFLETGKVRAVKTDKEVPGNNVCDWFRSSDYYVDHNETYFYLTGRAKSIQGFMQTLLRAGVNRKQIKTYPYWSEGKSGL